MGSTGSERIPTGIPTPADLGLGKLPKIKKPRLGLKGRIALIATLATAGASVGAYEAYHHLINPPGIHQATEISGSAIFDNAAKKGVIGPENTISMSQSEIDALCPDAFAKINDGKSTLQMQFILVTSTSSKPDANIAYSKKFLGAGLFDIPGKIAECRTEGYLDSIRFEDVPSLTTIISPVDGTLLLCREEDVKNPSNGSDITAALIDFIAPNGNHYRIAIGGEITKERTGFVFKSLANSPSLSIKNTLDGKLINTASSPIEIKKGKPIMEIIEAQGSIDISFRITIAREGKIGEGINMQNPSVPTNIELLTTQDKIFIPSGK